MTYQETITAVVKQTGRPRSATDDVLQGLRRAARALPVGGELTIRGLGTFRRFERAPRTGCNPRTGEPIQIPARVVLSFRPAAEQREG